MGKLTIGANLKHLIAIDEVEAVYWDDGRVDHLFDACEYIDKLISIRTPANLIEFLHTYPGGLVSLNPWVERVSAHKLMNDSNPPWFTAKRMNSAMEVINKKMGLGIDWIDSLNDELPNHIGINKEIKRLKSQTHALIDAINAVYSASKEEQNKLLSNLKEIYDAMPFDEGVDAYAANFYSLRLIHIALCELFKVAAVANGRGTTQFPIIRIDAGQDSWSDGDVELEVGPARRMDVMVPLSLASRLVPFMDEERVADSLNGFRVEESYIHLNRCKVIGDAIIFEDGYFLFDGTNKLPIRWTDKAISKFITSWALTEWLREYTSRQRVGFNDNGFYRKDTSTNEIVDAIFDYIANDRVGICERCGEPFVADRKEPDGSFSRRYCTKTCRNTTNKERANNG